MNKIILIPIFTAALFVAGCSTPSKTNSAAAGPAQSRNHSTVLEGAWHGNEITPGQQGLASMTFSGQTVEFHGADSNDWCKGTFMLRDNTDPKQLVGTITECPSADAVGKMVYAIYKIENGSLRITGNAPGDLNIPAAFDSSGIRQFVLKHD
ncbi:MAG: hypothetical protein ACLQU4_03820 [Limisphaerales bacterium]